MYIKNIEIKFPIKNLRVPTQGNFNKGINLITSLDNNRGKTTMIRAIVNALFSDSIDFPKVNKEIFGGDFNEIIINFEHKNEKGIQEFTLEYDSKTKKRKLLNNGSVIDIFNDSKDFLFNILNVPNGLKDRFSSAIVANRALLDQDFHEGNPKLFKSFFNVSSENKKIIEYWLIKGGDTFQKFDELEDVRELKKLIATQEKILQEINDNTNIITGIKSIDDDQIKKILDEFTKLKKEYKKLTNNILINQNKIKQYELLEGKNRQKYNDFKAMYFIAEDIQTQQKVQVKANFDNILNFTNKPINIAKSEIKRAKSELEVENKDYSRAIDKLSKKINNIRDTIDVVHLISEDQNILAKNIELNKNKLKKYIENNNRIKNEKASMINELKNMTKQLWNESDEIAKKFRDSSDSKSGSDLFINKIADYIAFARNMTMHNNIPLFLDSIKEKDFSNNNISKLIEIMGGIANANRVQVFMTGTNLPKSNKNIYEIKNIQ